MQQKALWKYRSNSTPTVNLVAASGGIPNRSDTPITQDQLSNPYEPNTKGESEKQMI